MSVLGTPAFCYSLKSGKGELLAERFTSSAKISNIISGQSIVKEEKMFDVVSLAFSHL